MHLKRVNNWRVQLNPAQNVVLFNSAQFICSVSSEDFAPGDAYKPTNHQLWTTQTYQPQNRPVISLTQTRLPCFVLTMHLSPLQSSKSGLTIDEVNYSISLTSRSHQGQLYQADYSSQPELYGVENAVPLAASLGTEQASAVWSASAGQFGMQRSTENKPDEIYIWSSSNMYCSALLCLIRLAPSWCPPGLAERDSTAQIVGGPMHKEC